MPKRILVVSQHFWPESFRINDICESFVERGYAVEVLCGIPNYPIGQYFEGYGITKNRRQTVNGIKIRRCFEFKRGSNTNLRIFLNYISFPISSLFALPYLLQQKYDKIFMFQTSPVIMSFVGILLGKLKKIETTMYVLDLWPENLYSVLNLKNKLLRKLISGISIWHYRNADKLIANSQGLQSILQERIGKSNVVYIPQFCEKLYETKIRDKALRDRYANTFNLVFTGNISPAQSFETVIGAAKILMERGFDDILWIIVGDGMSRAWLEDAISQEGLGDQFVFVGQIPMEEVPRYTGIADALFACLSKSELLDAALPGKIISYYAAGCPLVVAMDGEVKEIVESSKAGFAVGAEEVDGFADAIVALYSMGIEARQAMGDYAKAYYQQYFEREMNMDKLEAVLFGGNA